MITATLLTPEVFAPYGHVGRAGQGVVAEVREGQVRTTRSEIPFPHDPEAVDPSLDLHEVAPAAAPLKLLHAQRHPYSTQLFVPMQVSRWLVVVWPEGPAAPPVAFVAGPQDTVVYAPGVWHHGILALDTPALFAAFMWRTGRGDETESLPVLDPVTVDWPAP
ncbi:ureidoglycolate lyase [Mesobaculum littorinae]|uniref:ureidoglycolate lyase n=1 Tax=Mesobaculum littorinae TaxID=2486419 RepID=UPI0013E2D49C|nr:ureidoglycolate lyase [Mesobaculum littorinae]